MAPAARAPGSSVFLLLEVEEPGSDARPAAGGWQAKVMAAAAGRFHSAAVGEDGALFVWGSGAFGQLGTGDTARRLAPTRVAGLPAPVRQVAAGGFHTGIVTEAGDLLMCGCGGGGRLRSRPCMYVCMYTYAYIHTGRCQWAWPLSAVCIHM